MYWLIDVLLLVFLGWMIYRGVKKGFVNTSFSLVVYLLMLVLALGLAAGTVWLLAMFGYIREVQIAIIGVIGETNTLFEMLGVTSAQLSLYIAYALIGILLFIPYYIFCMWLEKLIERLFTHIREKSLGMRIIGSVLATVVNIALAAVVIVGVFGAVAFASTYNLVPATQSAFKAAPLSGMIYNLVSDVMSSVL